MLYSQDPHQARIDAINEAIVTGEVGTSNAILDERLRSVVPWLMKAADVKDRDNVSINDDVALDRLDIVITRPEAEKITRNSKGNASYDSDLDIIFIDESLAWPSEFEQGIITVESLGFVLSYTAFILAHELGHRELKHDSAGFFDFYFLFEKEPEYAYEFEADKFAIDTLIKAYSVEKVPEIVRELNALDMVGLSTVDLDSTGVAIGDILGSLHALNIVLQSTSIPYSPYFSDQTHPIFIDRIDSALSEQVGDGTLLENLRSYMPVQNEIVDRLRKTANVRKMTLFFDKQIHFVSISKSTIRVGVLPMLFDAATAVAEIYEFDMKNMAYDSNKVSDERQYSVIKRKEFMIPALDSESDSEDLEDIDGLKLEMSQWLASNLHQLDNSKKASGIVDTPCPFELKTWTITYDSMECVSQDHDVTLRERIDAAVTDVLGLNGFDRGLVFLVDGESQTAVVTDKERGEQSLHLLKISSNRPNITAEILSTVSVPGHLHLDGGSATFSSGQWWFSALLQEYSYSQAALVSLQNGQITVRETYRLLESFLGDGIGGDYHRELSPSFATIIPLDDNSFVYWYPEDSAYLWSEGTASLLFHPASGLEIKPVGQKHVAAWTNGGSKLYILQASRQP